MKNWILFLSLVAFTGCATTESLWKSLNNEEDKNTSAIKPDAATGATKYSQSSQMPVTSDRNYKKVTKNQLEEESNLGSQAGSLWVMDGQGSFLFSQNKTRQPGDLLNVKLEGAALKQVETKVKVIKQLLKQLEDQKRQEELKNNPKLADNSASREPASAQGAPAAKPAGAIAANKTDDKEESDSLADMESVPTRIVEKLPDGNYRIKGSQPFMIGKREYKVLITGLIRAEDFNDEGITSKKLLDPQFDVVSLRKVGARNE
ncbi:MAG: flagellar basal body L-ring protein FlgH [Pseudobdellovibrionaceae bacterium]